MPTSYLEKLNPQQRRAVEYGGSTLAKAGAGRQKARFFPPALSLKAHFREYPTDFSGLKTSATRSFRRLM